MILTKCTLLIGLILTLLSDPILGRKGLSGSHSYPKSSGGLSGGGHRSGGLSGGGHGYPSSGHSGGLSGGGHGYPSSGGSHSYPSSGGSHSYPSSGGSHSYPSSGGSHSYPSSGGSHSYPSSGGVPSYPSSGSNSKPISGGSHTYPSSGGTHTYPSSGKAHSYPSSSGSNLSGGGRGHPSNKPIHHTTTVHHYHYAPPTQITYVSPRGGAPIHYPVYHGPLPTYVNTYKNSGSKYGTLLAGLALMNLGTLGVATYAAHQSHQNHGSNSYKPQPGEICKFAIKKENGDYEETRIDCQIISSFILQDMEAKKTGNNSAVTTTTTVTNVTVVNTTNVGVPMPTQQPPVPLVPGPNIMYNMLPNGTLVPINVTGVNIPGIPGFVNVTQNQSMSSNPASSSVVVTTTTTNTTLVSALEVKGKPVDVTPGMQCFVIRNSPMGNMRKTVPCGLLQTYADRSLKRNSGAKVMPMFTFVAAILVYCVAY